MKSQVFISHASRMNGIIIAASSPKKHSYILSADLKRLMMGSRSSYARLLNCIRVS